MYEIEGEIARYKFLSNATIQAQVKSDFTPDLLSMYGTRQVDESELRKWNTMLKADTAQTHAFVDCSQYYKRELSSSNICFHIFCTAQYV